MLREKSAREKLKWHKEAREKLIDEERLLSELAGQFTAPTWAFLRKVRNAPGFPTLLRTADAIAMAVWPSRGLEINGFEIKTSREDWQRERRDPEKAEEIAQFCDKWWLVTSTPDVAKDEELPPSWGLKCFNGKELRTRKKPEQLKSKEPDRLFLASIMREFVSQVVPSARLRAERDRGYAEGFKEGQEYSTDGAKYAQRHLSELRTMVAGFEEKSGIKINSWNAGNIGEAVQVVLHTRAVGLVDQLRDIGKTAREIADDIAKKVNALDSIAKEKVV